MPKGGIDDFFFYRLAPIGVCSLVAARIADMDDILKATEKLGLYILTVIGGLIIHALVVLPLVFFVVTRKNPFTFMKGLTDALMTAFGISSRFVYSVETLKHKFRFQNVHGIVKSLKLHI